MITYTTECYPEDTPVRGNAQASGDDAADAATEQWVFDQLDAGNQWAWCTVRVVATFTAPDGSTWYGDDSLGCCSYMSQEDFETPGGYFDDMKAQARERLLANIRGAIDAGKAAKRALVGAAS